MIRVLLAAALLVLLSSFQCNNETQIKPATGLTQVFVMHR